MTPASRRGALRAVFAALAVTALSGIGCGPRPAHLAGRVVARGQPVSDALVAVEAAQGPYHAEVRTGDDGVYRFEGLPPGTYLLTSRTLGPPPAGARSGKNPIAVAPGAQLWVGLQQVPLEHPAYRDYRAMTPGFGALSGVVRADGREVEGAIVDVYLDHGPGTPLRGPGFRQSFPTGSDGAYVVEEVPEGLYHLVGRKRRAGSTAGPVLEGDLYGEALANPVAVRAGTETVLDLHLVRKERDDDPNADLWPATGTGVAGLVVDPDGNPVAGIYVFAYRNRTIGHGMPDHRTLPTGPDGRFALSLGEGGLFYVGARQNAGGSPVPGEWFGFYEGSPDHGLTVPKGNRRTGVEIVVRKVLAP